MVLGRALEVMDRRDARGTPVPFAITWATFDHRRGTGGEIRHLPAAIRCGAKHNLQRNRQIAIRPVEGGHPIPIHLRLILRVNGEYVL